MTSKTELLVTGLWVLRWCERGFGNPIKGLHRLRRSAKKIIKKNPPKGWTVSENCFTFVRRKRIVGSTNKQKKRTNMEQITKIPVYKSEKIYQVCTDFITLYPEMGEKIFDNFKYQFNEAALKFNSVNTIVEVVYQIRWGETEEGFLWWHEFYTHLKKILGEQLETP